MSDAAAEVPSSHCMPVHPLLVASHACGAASCCLRPNQKMLLQSTLRPHLWRPQPHIADAQSLQLVRQGRSKLCCLWGASRQHTCSHRPATTNQAGGRVSCTPCDCSRSMFKHVHTTPNHTHSKGGKCRSCVRGERRGAPQQPPVASLNPPAPSSAPLQDNSPVQLQPTNPAQPAPSWGSLSVVPALLPGRYRPPPVMPSCPHT